MARRAAATIHLGAHQFDIRPLTLDQVEQIESELGEGEIKQSVKAAKAIVAIGLQRDHPDVKVGEIEATVVEIGAAMGVVLRQGGFVPDQPGEEQAAAKNALIGEKCEDV